MYLLNIANIDFTIFLTTRSFQLVVYIVWLGESESAVHNNKILHPEEKIKKNIIYKTIGKKPDWGAQLAATEPLTVGNQEKSGPVFVREPVRNEEVISALAPMELTPTESIVFERLRYVFTGLEPDSQGVITVALTLAGTSQSMFVGVIAPATIIRSLVGIVREKVPATDRVP